MPAYILLLRAVNVGGTGKLPMAKLKAMCEDAGFAKVRTYIASGNVVFESKLPVRKIRAAIESRLLAHAGKPVGVHIRSLEEMVAVLKANPFGSFAPNRSVAIFLEEAPPKSALEEAVGLSGEKLHLGLREIYVAYGDGMADSKLRIPAAKAGTARNMNTVAKLAALAAAIGE
ncbi:MAG TPA: DUF1697 domain-containing protein [Opitutaceae bacterium]|nr:DUF1697 domain-containing protein [Opitutaceae bacterium]